MPSRCRSVALLALLALATTLPGPAASGSETPERLGVPLVGDETTPLPVGAPMPTGATGLGPGTLLLLDLADGTYLCTANWAWRAGDAHYLGAAGHCFLSEDGISTHGADRNENVSGVRVRACVYACEFSGQLGFLLRGTTVELGEVAYARQTRHGADIGNDFGLVRIPDPLVGDIRRALPVWGSASSPTDVRAGALTCLYGNGVAVGETYLTKARLGTGIMTLRDGSWRAALPSAPGDSGSAVATCSTTLAGTRAVGAVGVLTHLSTTGIAGTTLAQAAKMAREADLDVAPLL